jgi:hypothetical protein
MGRRVLVMLLLGAGIAGGQELPDAPISKATWATFAGLGAEILADGVTTRVLYQRQYDEINPLAKPFVHAGVPGQAGASLLGAAAIGGVWFVLRRTHHDRAAGWFLRSVTAGEGCNVARQFMLLRTSLTDSHGAGSGSGLPVPGLMKRPSVRRAR